MKFYDQPTRSLDLDSDAIFHTYLVEWDGKIPGNVAIYDGVEWGYNVRLGECVDRGGTYRVGGVDRNKFVEDQIEIDTEEIYEPPCSIYKGNLTFYFRLTTALLLIIISLLYIKMKKWKNINSNSRSN